MKENRNEVIIEATSNQVWDVLTDLDKYSEWNPLLYRGKGEIKLGETVVVDAKTATKDMNFVCEVIKVDPLKEFAWKFHVFHPILFRGVHSFQIEPLGEKQVIFMDRESFKGLLLPTQSKDLTTTGLNAMVEMGKALKKRVENLP
ncbi:MAG: SRPBCC domain-containing protein [Anaerolineaceae bacterium]|nr:SRPBCC domain-containing protein [Anaerolineaceae bacterium]